MNKHELPRQILYIRDVAQLIGRSPLTIRRWYTKDKFPMPVLISKRLAWKADVIDAWINNNV